MSKKSITIIVCIVIIVFLIGGVFNLFGKNDETNLEENGFINHINADTKVRDVAEYLKAMFFKKDMEYCLDELRSYLSIRKLNIYEYHMFYARLLYPSYYFDVYDSVMNKNVNEEELVKIVKRSNDYEEFLKKTYLEISKYVRLDKIDWIIEGH